MMTILVTVAITHVQLGLVLLLRLRALKDVCSGDGILTLVERQARFIAGCTAMDIGIVGIWRRRIIAAISSRRRKAGHLVDDAVVEVLAAKRVMSAISSGDVWRLEEAEEREARGKEYKDKLEHDQCRAEIFSPVVGSEFFCATQNPGKMSSGRRRRVNLRKTPRTMIFLELSQS